MNFSQILSIAALLLLTVNLPLTAHVIGHQPSGNSEGRTWALSGGSFIEGDFSHAVGDNAAIRTSEGTLKTIPLSQFSINDQKIIAMKISRLAQLNRQTDQPRTATGRKFSSLLTLAALVLGAAVLLVISVRVPATRPWSKGILTAGLFSLGLFIACNDDAPASSGNPIAKTSTSFLSAAYSRFAPAVATSWDEDYFYIASNGIPAHGMMTGITSWQQQVPIIQDYTGTNRWSIPLQPEFASIPLSTKTNLMKGAVAVAVNGIPIFNALNNRGEDSYAIGELDQWGGHCGRADDYHYHAAPLHLAATDTSLPIAFALDGFPVYGSSEPDGTIMDPLDPNHGHAWEQDAYHYHGTSDYPYVVGAMQGKVKLDPATPAPENQILPQAFAKPLRPATSPLKGAVITSYENTGERARRLVYRIGLKEGSVEYSWDTAGKYTFILTDTAGAITTQVYQR